MEHIFLAQLLPSYFWEIVDNNITAQAQMLLRRLSTKRTKKFDPLEEKTLHMPQRIDINLTDNTLDGVCTFFRPATHFQSRKLCAVSKEQLYDLPSEIRPETCRIICKTKPHKSNMSTAERLALRRISLVVLPT